MNLTSRHAFFWRVLFCSYLLPIAVGLSNESSERPIIAEFVPPDARAVLVLRPRMLLSRLPDSGIGAAMYAREYQRTSFRRPLLAQLSRVIESSGLLLSDVDEIGAVVGVNPPVEGESSEGTNTEEADVSLLPPDVMFVLRFRKALPDDLPALLLHKPLQHKLTNGPTVFTASEVDGKYLYGIWFLDSKTIAICPLAAISRVLEAKTAKSTGLRAATNAMPSTQAGMLVATGEALADVGLEKVPVFSDASYVRLNLDIAAPAALTVNVVYSAAKRAEAAVAEWRAFAPAGKALIDTAVVALRERRPHIEPASRQAVSELGGSLAKSLEGFKVATKGNRVDASVPLTLGLDGQAIENLMLVPSKVIDRLTLEEKGAMTEDEDPPLPTLRRFDVGVAQSVRKQIMNDEASFELFRQIPQATGLPAAYVVVIGSTITAPTITQFPNQPVISLLFEESRYSDSLVDRRNSLYFADASPSEVFYCLHQSLPFGTGTLINCEDIKSFECTRDGETAKGVFAFESRMVMGSLPFAAKRIAGRWEFVRFELPAWGLECRRNKDGEWEMADDFGRLGSTQPRVPARITIVRDGEPLPDVEGITLYRNPQLFPLYGQVRNGTVEIPLFPGRYFVELESRQDGLPERYRRAVTSGLIVTIPQKGDESAIMIDLK